MRFFRIITVLVAAFLAAAAKPQAGKPATEKDARLAVLDAMQTELERNTKSIKLEDYDLPYFLSYQLIDQETYLVEARFGAIFVDDSNRRRQLYVESRVGSYDKDNTARTPDSWFGGYRDGGYYASKAAPIEDDSRALRNTLWLLTDEEYKEALSAYLKKKSDGVFKVETEDDKIPSFTREQPSKFVQEPVNYNFNRREWLGRIRKYSEFYKAYPEIFDSTVKLHVTHEVRYYVNSEGSRLVTEDSVFVLDTGAVTRADDGMLLDNDRNFYGSTAFELPPAKKFEAEMKELVDELLALRKAEVLDPFTGPAILSAEATGVLFHEAVGHRLEGERQHDEKEGQTFKGQVGKQIISPIISLSDDPTMEKYGDTSLNGHYLYDNEGVKAENVLLVENGILKSFLLSRTPVKGFLKSNGHGRSQGMQKPMARMGNLAVTSSNAVSDEELKKVLMEEARKQEKPFGLLIKNIIGGDTNTSSYGYQAYRGRPRLVYKIDAQTGAETLVRGVEIVGTPLTSINKIIATSRESEVYNGYCGAESGSVPSSVVSPAALIREVELQRIRKEAEKLPILDSPWAAPADKSK